MPKATVNVRKIGKMVNQTTSKLSISFPICLRVNTPYLGVRSFTIVFQLFLLVIPHYSWLILIHSHLMNPETPPLTVWPLELRKRSASAAPESKSRRAVRVGPPAVRRVPGLPWEFGGWFGWVVWSVDGGFIVLVSDG